MRKGEGGEWRGGEGREGAREEGERKGREEEADGEGTLSSALEQPYYM